MNQISEAEALEDWHLTHNAEIEGRKKSKRRNNMPKVNEQIVKELEGMGFSDDVIERPRRLIVSVSGKPKTGKTHFALTAPDPIFFINVDIGTEGVLDKFQAEGKRIYVHDVRVPKTGSKDVYVPMWENLKNIFKKVFQVGAGTVIADTGTEVYELARLAKFGKLTQVMPQHYTEVNSEFREVLRLAYESSMNMVFIHKMKPVYIQNQRTNEYEPSGQSDMGYNTQANVTTYREDTDEGTKFSAFIKDCRHNPNVNGQLLEDEMCSFDFLLDLVHGG